MKYIQYIIFSLLLFICFLLLEGPMFHIPYYHEQHHLFLFNQAYLEKHLSHPGQLLDYLTDFCIQFFYLTHIGKLVFALLLSLPFLLNTLTVKNLIQKQDYWVIHWNCLYLKKF